LYDVVFGDFVELGDVVLGCVDLFVGVEGEVGGEGVGYEGFFVIGDDGDVFFQWRESVD